MSAITLLDPAGYQRFSWKNGGGVTTDIAAAYRPGAKPGGWDGLLWRFGYTPITAPGPFSSLPGIDRCQVVVGGRGLMLETPDGDIDLRQPFAPVRFAGETPIHARLEDGPVVVVNLLGARAAVTLSMVVLQPDRPHVLTAGFHIAYACSGDAVLECPGPHPIASDHAVRIESGGGMVLTARQNRMVLASVANKENALEGREIHE